MDGEDRRNNTYFGGQGRRLVPSGVVEYFGEEEET